MNKPLSLQQKLAPLLSEELPAFNDVYAEAKQIAGATTVGRTAALDKWGVSSELEFKQACIRDRVVTYHVHIGMGNWELTRQSLAHIYREAGACNIEVHRAGLCLDRRMALPEAQRAAAAAETGPMLETLDDWRQVGQDTPIQPHMGDFMIGFPASVANSVHALRAGVTTIGNLSQFFAHQAPGWRDPVVTALETCKSIALLGRLRDKGVVLHSYLEDGFGALFFDCATIAGWAFLERYIVEDLLGAKLSHCIGGLTSDPVKRAGWVFALDRIHDGECVGSMFYGDTISFTGNFDENLGLVSDYMLWDIMAQLKCPTGHAVLPLPVTEAVRTPSTEEILQAQILGHRTEKAARRLVDFVDFSPSMDFADRVVSHGKAVFHRALEGLREAGVDERNPLQMLFVLKAMGPALFEETFGAGEYDERQPRQRVPVIPTDIFAQSIACYRDHRPYFQDPGMAARIAGKRLLLASSDVHEHAIMVLNWLLGESGAQIVYLGAEADAELIAARAQRDHVDAVLVSTHNGMALEFGRRLTVELARLGLRKPVLLGGHLNQKIPEAELPVDVSSELKQLGIHVGSSALDQRLANFLQLEKPEKDE